MMSSLEALRTSLSSITGVVSCKIGIEANISPADYPLIRIVPTRITPGAPYNKRSAECLIHFGAQKNLSEGLESVYTALFAMEDDIINKVKTLGGTYLETITDSDELDAYKMMAVRFRIIGAQAAPPPPPAPAPAPAP